MGTIGKIWRAAAAGIVEWPGMIKQAMFFSGKTPLAIGKESQVSQGMFGVRVNNNRRMNGSCFGVSRSLCSLPPLAGSHASESGSQLHNPDSESRVLNAITALGTELKRSMSNMNRNINSRLGRLESSVGHRTERELATGVEKRYGARFAESLSAQSIIDLVSLVPSSELPGDEREQRHSKLVRVALYIAQVLVDKKVPVEFLKHLHQVTRFRAETRGMKVPGAGGAGVGNDTSGAEAANGKAGAGGILPDEATVVDINSWDHLLQNADDRHLHERVADYLHATDSNKAEALARCQSIGISVVLFAIDRKFVFPVNEKETLTFYTELEFDIRGRMTLYHKMDGLVTTIGGSIETGECKSSAEFGKALKQLAVRLYVAHWILSQVVEMQGVRMGYVSKIGRLFVPRSKEEQKLGKVIKDTAGGVERALKSFQFSLHVEYL